MVLKNIKVPTIKNYHWRHFFITSGCTGCYVSYLMENKIYFCYKYLLLLQPTIWSHKGKTTLLIYIYFFSLHVDNMNTTAMHEAVSTVPAHIATKRG